jgi:hypothetical protein
VEVSQEAIPVIRVVCPKCKTVANLPDAAAGKTAVCKCGQKIAVPAPGAPVAAPAAAPKPPAPAPEDDLVPQIAGEEKKKGAPPPSFCPACKAKLPAGEEVCLKCGYMPSHLKRKKGDKKVVQGATSRDAAWAQLAQKPNPGIVDFITAAFAGAVWMAIASLIGNGIKAGLVFFGGLTGLFILVLHCVYGWSFLAPQIGLYIIWAALLVLWLYASGTATRGPFALCQAICFGHDEPRVADWPTFRTGALFSLIALLPALLGGVTFLASRNPVAAGIVALFVAVCVVPICFLSVAQAGGSWSALSPARIGLWLGKLNVPYLGVMALVLVDVAIVAGISAFAFAAAGAGVFAEFMSSLAMDARQAMASLPYGTFFGLAGIGVASVVISLHPAVYMSAMLGMLYRKYERRLIAS